MVKVEIVEEDAGNSPYSSASSSRTGSTDSLSSVSDNGIAPETLFDRLVALVDIVPPSTRHSISTRVENTANVVKRTGRVVGNIIWVITTSALLIGLPLALALEDEAKIIQQEKELQEQQQGVQQMLAPTSPYSQVPAQGKAAQGLVPPGF
ncbi:mitochondrial import translocase, subunit Tom22 [Exidia glandulosa HHB12029]|uniref:Mitochondrial import translocase, subunit Tom22 n=1 Tax=Exidia glandulosa HHB12029 TaxID=1314781 RepID=A0A165GZF8_EXIGL|nr:mitochondrial import translocase, subunit Tom22 [Exidia glandulosa HHB12029]